MITILGKSNYALSIICDMINLISPSEDVFIVPNIDNKENTSIDFPFMVDNLNVKEISLSQFDSKNYEKYVLGSIGKGRNKIYQYFESHFGINVGQFINLVHPSAVIAKTVTLGLGVHISPLSVVAPYAEIGDFVTVNRNASIGHHTKLGKLACVNPGVNIAGICDIGENVTIGAGSTVIDKVKIGSNSIVGAGSVVTKDLPSNVVAYGVPAKIIREIE